jgi:hypothetical protein
MAQSDQEWVASSKDGLQATVAVVPLVGPDGQPWFRLEQRHWAEGIGWYTQKTILLDAAQARQLQQLLAAHTAALESRFAQHAPPSPERDDRGRVIPFRPRAGAGAGRPPGAGERGRLIPFPRVAR